MAEDPVCKMEVDDKTARWKSVYKGKNILLLCSGVQEKIRRKPGRIF